MREVRNRKVYSAWFGDKDLVAFTVFKGIELIEFRITDVMLKASRNIRTPGISLYYS